MVRKTARRVHTAERLTDQLLEKFKPVVFDAIKSVINDRFNDRLSSAMTEETNVLTADLEHILEAAAVEHGVVFTEDEREGLYIVCAICSS